MNRIAPAIAAMTVAMVATANVSMTSAADCNAPVDEPGPRRYSYGWRQNRGLPPGPKASRQGPGRRGR